MTPMADNLNARNRCDNVRTDTLSGTSVLQEISAVKSIEHGELINLELLICVLPEY